MDIARLPLEPYWPAAKVWANTPWHHLSVPQSLNRHMPGASSAGFASVVIPIFAGIVGSKRRRFPVAATDRRQHCCQVRPVQTESTAALATLARLQGHWEDDLGNVIFFTGDLARFSDGTGAWKIEVSVDGTLEVRGAKLVGTSGKPVWRFPNGVERRCKRRTIARFGELAWAESFHEYKDAQLQLRQRLWASIVAKEFEAASLIKASCEASGAFPVGCSLEQQAVLAAGRKLLPGVCFIHRRYGYRGVILSCEPWCTAPSSWRSRMRVAGTAHGERQPFYHCLVDERDRRGGQSTFVPEKDIEACDAVFPVQHWLLPWFFLPSSEIRGYLPKPKLDDVMWKQWASDCPVWNTASQGGAQ